MFSLESFLLQQELHVSLNCLGLTGPLSIGRTLNAKSEIGRAKPLPNSYIYTQYVQVSVLNAAQFIFAHFMILRYCLKFRIAKLLCTSCFGPQVAAATDLTDVSRA